MTISIWILGDQLLEFHPAILAAENAAHSEDIRIVMVESDLRIARLPYHRRKLVLLLSAMRHFADDLRDLGHVVDYQRTQDFESGLRNHIAHHAPDRLITMAASEYPTRELQSQLASRLDIAVDVIPNTQFLTGQFDSFPQAASSQKVVMEQFYRAMRRHFSVLIDTQGSPVGGAWNFDKENRKPLKRGIDPPAHVTFQPDPLTLDVMHQVEQHASAIGTAKGFDLAVTRDQALVALDDFITNRLPDFGPYEDAMSSSHDVLFHSVLSPYLNIGLLQPMELIRAAETAYHEGRAPIQSVEGFVRQIIGWREFMYWQYVRQMPDLWTANAWQADRPLPEFFWGGSTELNCLRHVIQRVAETGYSHHIERLMVVCTFCLMAGIDPRQVTEWFLSFYIDAYEWVVLPNVIGMGLNADGGVTATKPYIASGAYINRMSDYCSACRYNPKERVGDNACPFTTLYWNFLSRHEARLRANPRLGPAVLGLGRLDSAEREAIEQAARRFLVTLTPYEPTSFDATA